MAKKTRQNPPKPKEFQSAPFGSLKNLVVPDEIKVQPPAPPAQKKVAPADNSLDLFMREVADVRPIHRQDAQTTTKAPQHLSKNAAEAKRASSPVTELTDNLFLQEINRLKLDTKFSDSVPDDGELVPLSGNRLRQVKRGVVSIEHQLDLHGLRRDEALTALPRFLQSARNRGQKAVLVITGKGNHSAEEPVLQQAVASWLREAGRELVLEFAPAPRELGGSGALVVFLRPARLSG